jgi:hypothetical protein
MSFREVDEMFLDEWNSLNQSFIDHPPADLLLAARYQYKAPGRTARNAQEAARQNSEVLKEMPMLTRRAPKTLNQMPTFLQTPEKMALIQQMKAEMGVANG